MGGEEKRPPFATGEIVGDYGLLFKYWELCGEEERDKAMLSNKDFEDLRRLVDAGYRRLSDILELLEERMLSRVDPAKAREAFKQYYGVDVDPETARRRIARLLASWLVEAGSTWKILRLRGSLPRD